jgi:pyrroline-5-carboxylate reductase
MHGARVKAAVFVGGGRITGALLAGLQLAGDKTPIIVHDRNAHKLRALRREYGVSVEPQLAPAVAQASVLMIAVRPDSVAETLDQIRAALRISSTPHAKNPPLIACSLAAGIPLAKLRNRLGAPVFWARAMPSPGARTRQGLTTLTFDRGFPTAARSRLKKFFAQVGPVLEIPESKFDAFTVTFSPSHGYHALATLAHAAQKLGLDRQTAFAAAAHALADAIVSWRQGKNSLDALLHEAATPGGIAATVMRTMDEAAYPRIVERALRAGVARARKNARL